MTTNLLFGTNRYFRDATITASDTATGYDLDSIATGGRGEHWKSDSETTSHFLKYYVSTAAQANYNYFAMARADLIINGGTTPTFTIARSTDDSSYTTIETDSTPELAGPNGEDFCIISSATHEPVAATYYRLTIGFATNAYAECSKLYMGEALDLGRDPIGVKMVRTRRGHCQRKARYEIDLKYSGITYANAETLLETVAESMEWHPVFLMTRTYHSVLQGCKVIHADLIDIETPQELTGYNNIRMVFRELI